MSSSSIHAAAVIGASGHLVTVQAFRGHGQRALHLVGLSDLSQEGAHDRIKAAAIETERQAWPDTPTVVELGPVGLPKHGTGFDLAIAVSVLAAHGHLPASACAGRVFIGELTLDGKVQPVPGVLPAVLAAVEAGQPQVVVPWGNRQEAQAVPGAQVVAVPTLAALLRHLRGQAADVADEPYAGPQPASFWPYRDVDLADLPGHPAGRRALEICAAGGHGLFMIGSSLTGTTMIAERLPGLVPDLSAGEALEVSAVRSVAGLLSDVHPMIDRPPFIAPHHTAPRNALLGAMTVHGMRPGMVSLAHTGFLFLEDAAEFRTDDLRAVAAALLHGEVRLQGGDVTATLPAHAHLIVQTSPCPCFDPPVCRCTSAARGRYLARIPADLLDLTPVKIRVEMQEPRTPADQRESTAVAAVRVAQARERAAARWAQTPWTTNAQLPGLELRRRGRPSTGAALVLDDALRAGQINYRGAERVLATGWTLADLAGHDRPSRTDLLEALTLYLGTTTP